MEKNTEQLDAIEQALKDAADEEILAVALSKVAILVSGIAENKELLDQMQADADAGADASCYQVACELVYKQTRARLEKTHPMIADKAAAFAVCILERATRATQDKRQMEALMSGGARLLPMQFEDE